MLLKKRFRSALEQVLVEKKIAFDIPVGRFQQVSDRVFSEVRPPFFRRMYDWIIEHWDEILKVLMIVIPMFL